MNAPTTRSPGARNRSWPLLWLVVVAGCVALDDVLDAAVIKRGSLAMLAAVLAAPALALVARDAIGDWFTSGGGRWFALATLPALVGAFTVWPHADVSDRLVGFALAQVAAVAGLAAGRAALGQALTFVAFVTALVAGAQALGIEHSLTTGPDEIVALAGNSTRAGALLALGVVALAARQLAGGKRSLVTTVLLALATAGLVLTRARGAIWVAAPIGLAAVVMTSLRSRATNDDDENEDEEASGDARAALPRLALALFAGLVVATLIGGDGTLQARKLQDQASPLSGSDLTTNVRLALWSSSWHMAGDRPWLGWGYGRFASEFPPYRDPVEAALPGLAGAETSALHPHNELLLGAVEGGLIGGALLLLFVGLTLARALRGHGGPLTLGVLVAGTALALVQDAWTDPGTAVPFFAAVGVVWARSGRQRPSPTRRDAPAGYGPGLALVALAIGAALLATPRFHAHMLARSWYLRTEASGELTADSFDLVVRAADAAPGDVQLQRLLGTIGAQWAPRAATVDDKVAAIQAVDRAAERIGSHGVAPSRHGGLDERRREEPEGHPELSRGAHDLHRFGPPQGGEAGRALCGKAGAARGAGRASGPSLRSTSYWWRWPQCWWPRTDTTCSPPFRRELPRSETSAPACRRSAPSTTFAHFPAPVKLFLAGCMIAGRLELFTLLILLTPGFWRS